MKYAWLIILVFAVSVTAEDKAPLPGKLIQAKTIFLENQTGHSDLLDGAYEVLKEWGRWEIARDKESADLIFLIDGTEGTKTIHYTVPRFDTYIGSSSRGTIYSSGKESLEIPDNKWFLHVLDASSGQSLWTTHAGGELTVKRSGRELIKSLQRRFPACAWSAGCPEKAEAKQPALPTDTPKSANESPSAQTIQQVEPSTVTFKSRPEGADITVDGKFIGSTPSTVQLAPGNHEVTIQKRESDVRRIEGGEVTEPIYKIWRRILTVNSGGAITVDATLEKVQ